MNIFTLFTTEEKETFLAKNGYELVYFTENYWDQWGNHDSQGEWKKRNHLCAVKDGEAPSVNNVYYKVFEQVISNKFKQFILQSL
jgi:hypothetical protein